jgi:hypothetical protein
MRFNRGDWVRFSTKNWPPRCPSHDDLPGLIGGFQGRDRGGRFRLVADVFLHETVHQWQHEVLGDLEDGYHGHGPKFRDQCNRIGALLGLPPVRTSKARGKDKALPSCAY